MSNLNLENLLFNGNYVTKRGFKIGARGANYMRYPAQNALKTVTIGGKKCKRGALLAPGMYQGEIEFNLRKAELIETLIKKIPEGPECFGLANLYCDWTFFSNPPNTPVKDIDVWRRELNLAPKMSPKLKQWAYKCLDYIYERMEPANIRINRLSHSGPPFFAKGVEKVALVYDAIERAPELIDTYNNKNLTKLIKEGWIPLASEGRRVDLAKVGYENGKFVQKKKLKVNPAYSKSTWTGEPFNGPISVPINFSSPEPDITGPLFAGALRRVMANNIAINSIVQIFTAAVQTAFHKIDCLRITHETDILKRMRGKRYTATYDFSSYDTTNPYEMWSLIYSYLAGKIFTEDMCAFLLGTHNLPIISPSADTVSKDPFLYGNFFQTEINAGVYSGHAGVPIDGKIPAFIIGTWLIHQYTGLELETIAENQDKRVFALFMSDDGKVDFEYEGDRDGYIKHVEKERSAGRLYYDLQWESYGNFLGTAYWDGKIYYNLMRSLSKVLNSERDKTNKANLALGFSEMLARQSKNSYFDLFCQEVGKLYSHYGHDIFAMSKTVPPNSIIAEFLEKPAIIFYKYIKPEDLPEDIIEFAFTTIEWPYCFKKMEKYLRKDSVFYRRFINEF